jgi:hypothetical protein
MWLEPKRSGPIKIAIFLILHEGGHSKHTKNTKRDASFKIKSRIKYG